VISTVPPELSSAELARYARQIAPGGLTEIGQRKLKSSTVLISRVGGMGGPAAMALAAGGVGRIILAHSGALEEPDLNRQVLGSEGGLGESRVHQFADRLRSLNRWLVVDEIDREPDAAESLELARRSQVVVSAAPNFPERLKLNRAAVAAGTPFIDAAQWGMNGTLCVVRPGETACLECLYPEPPPFEEFFPVVGAISMAIGSLAALEAIKILSGCGESLAGKMLIYDGAGGSAPRLVKLARRSDCAACGQMAKGNP